MVFSLGLDSGRGDMFILKQVRVNHSPSQISHNTSFLPPKFGLEIVFSFSWDNCNTQKILRRKVMQNFEEQALYITYIYYIRCPNATSLCVTTSRLKC